MVDSRALFNLEEKNITFFNTVPENGYHKEVHKFIDLVFCFGLFGLQCLLDTICKQNKSKNDQF